jgi:VWFA-related protein
MTGRGVTLSAALVTLATGLVGAQGSTSPQTTDQPSARFRSAVDLVSVAAVVRDRKGRFVSDLTSKDFIVVEAGQRRPIVSFRAEDNGPVKLAILFDVSGSMRVGSKAVDARQAARHILGALKSGDQAALFSFDTRLEKVHDFTSNFDALESSLGRIEAPFGQTSLYDAVAETAKAVVAAAGTKGKLSQRAAVAVLTDGVDTRSRLRPNEVASMASGIDVPVYIVAVMTGVDEAQTFGSGEETAVAADLRELAQWTGGELFTASAPAHASVAARQLVNELRHQYLLAFEASAQSGWRPVQIRARDRDLVVRARSGYTAGGRSSALTSGSAESSVGQGLRD